MPCPSWLLSANRRGEVAIYVLDTSAVLAHFRKEKGWERVQALAEDPKAILLLVSISMTEFARRLGELGFPTHAIDNAVANYKAVFSEILPVDGTIALAAVEVGRRSTARLPLVDCLIAAAARERQACLVHRDRHFATIPDNWLSQLDLAAESAPVS